MIACRENSGRHVRRHHAERNPGACFGGPRSYSSNGQRVSLRTQLLTHGLLFPTVLVCSGGGQLPRRSDSRDTTRKIAATTDGPAYQYRYVEGVGKSHIAISSEAKQNTLDPARMETPVV